MQGSLDERPCTDIPNSALRIPHYRTQKPAPANRSGVPMRSWRPPTLPRPRSRSTIGADRLNDRVRDGDGGGPVALVASKKTWQPTGVLVVPRLPSEPRRGERVRTSSP